MNLLQNQKFPILQRVRKPLEIIFAGNGSDEALHIKVDVNENVVLRWSFYDNSTQEPQGEPGDGTSIDLEEPFVIR